MANKKTFTKAIRWVQRRLGIDRNAILREPSASGVARVLNSGLFDAAWYAKQIPGQFQEPADQAAHYLRTGWRSGRDPGPHFDTKAYALEVPRVRRARLNPLLHYLMRGGGRRHSAATPPPLQSGLDNPEVWSRAAPRRLRTASNHRRVNVVIPVYDGREISLNCLWSVLTSIDPDLCQVIVVNDCSPDPLLTEILRELNKRNLFILHENEMNLGFVKSANNGMSLHRDRDVVLLNADTLVHGDWVERLQRHAEADPSVASITPFSNNATICSYPYPNQYNAGSHGADPNILDRLTADANAGFAVEIPTCVGFCVYLRREALDAVGLFDEGAFGRGYGEENDLSRRFVASGWRNILAADVYVHHFGEVSFGPDAGAQRAKGMGALLTRHPDYLDKVRAYIAVDPARPARAALDTARLSLLAPPTGTRSDAGAVLMITHFRGGGTETVVSREATALEAEGRIVIIARPLGDEGLLIERWGLPPMPNLSPSPWCSAIATLETVARAVDVREMRIHHTVDMPADFVAALPSLGQRLGTTQTVWLHDYLMVCPRITMVDSSGNFCGAPVDTRVCDACVRRSPKVMLGSDVAAWRQRSIDFLKSADRVFAPDASVATTFRRLLGSPAITVQTHDHLTLTRDSAAWPREDEIRRILVLGAIGIHKGSLLLEDVALHALRQRLPLEFHVIGYAKPDTVLKRLRNVKMTGRYGSTDVRTLIDKSGASIAWFPGQYPETFCFTLSEILEAGLFPVCFDVGAVAARCRTLSWGAILPLREAKSPARLARYLVSLSLPPKRFIWQRSNSGEIGTEAASNNSVTDTNLHRSEGLGPSPSCRWK